MSVCYPCANPFIQMKFAPNGDKQSTIVCGWSAQTQLSFSTSHFSFKWKIARSNDRIDY